MVEASVSVKLRAEGAEEVKRQLLETRAAALGVSSAQLEHAESMRNAARDARLLNNVQSFQSRIILAQHPSLNALTRGMKEFGAASRGVLAITTAFSTAFTAFKNTNSDLLDLQGQLAQAQRDYNTAIEQGNTQAAEEAAEKVNILKEKIKELNEQMVQGKITNILNFGAAIGVMASSIIQAAPQIAQLITKLRAMQVAFLGLNVSMGLIGLIAAGVAIAAILIIENWEPISKFFTDLGVMFLGFYSAYITPFVNTTTRAFIGFAGALLRVWDTIRDAFVGFWNGMITVTNTAIGGIVRGIEGFANSFIHAVNAMIRVYNGFAGAINMPKISTLGKISLTAPQIPLVAAANGFSGVVSQPTLFLAGEVGQEQVHIIPSGRAGSSGTTVIQHFHIGGSVIAEREVGRIADEYLKRELRRSGFTGY